MRRHLAAAIAIGLAIATACHAQERDERATINGDWRLAITQEEARSRVDRGIARAVEAMPPLVKDMAASQLRERTPVPNRVTIAATPTRIVVRIDEREYASSPRVAHRTRAAGGGEMMHVTQHFRGEGLEQVFESEGGTRWNTFVVGDDGTTLQLDAVIQSPRLPEAVRFTLPFRRAS